MSLRAAAWLLASVTSLTATLCLTVWRRSSALFTPLLLLTNTINETYTHYVTIGLERLLLGCITASVGLGTRLAFCRIVPRRQCIAFSISVLDEWEWMAKRLAILENVSFAVIPQPPYVSTTRGTHIQPLSRQPKALFSNFSCSSPAAEAPEV